MMNYGRNNEDLKLLIESGMMEDVDNLQLLIQKINEGEGDILMPVVVDEIELMVLVLVGGEDVLVSHAYPLYLDGPHVLLELNTYILDDQHNNNYIAP